MLSIATVGDSPDVISTRVRTRRGVYLHMRPLLISDVDSLTVFLESLSPITQERWTLDGYDREQASAFCDGIGRYDKLRLVATKESATEIVALFEFSFGIPQGDRDRYSSYGIVLGEQFDCRFGPCVRDDFQNLGVASSLMPFVKDIARQFGKQRMILWGGVLSENTPAIALYNGSGFVEVGRFLHPTSGRECVDMLSDLDGGVRIPKAL